MQDGVDFNTIIVGLGNPGIEYERTRHNVGRWILELIAERNEFFAWELNKNLQARTTDGELEGKKVAFVLPETFMNKSGVTVKKLVSSKKDIEKLIIVQDDIDIPLGTIKFSEGKGDGGHNGIDSIIKALGTKNFVRLRIGICPVKRGTNEPLKPSGEQEVHDFVLGTFKVPEQVIVSNVSNTVEDALKLLLKKGLAHAMNKFN